ncbi:hypothetical protein ES319_D06G013100v1 [Gossypium barbadense]|uniref:NB-ARC domain-containing protein n=2 Tax=Gossypium TaxID=3633 RepID=A0A5J5QW63_GOSBA|nr:hypothetical protein ES319_D06G013100v1 [Gossypium barbadense]
MTKDKLLALWMANGFIPSRGALDLHDMGCEIFSELTWRSFFQEIEEDVDGTVACKMHDLIHDLATSIMRQECCVIEPNEMSQIPKTAPHLFVYHYNISPSTNIMDLTTLQQLQSLILCGDGYFNHSNPSRFISKQKYLKVLHLGFYMSNIEFKISKHLRYLYLHNSTVKTLPESTSSLLNLQTLSLKDCGSHKMLPKGTKNLKNLRYLDIRGCHTLTSMPVALGQLSFLRKLSIFILGKKDGCGIDELKELALEGELSIKGLTNVKSAMEAKKANLIKKHN